jgi:3-phosphoshikimate 1-carboxyvinyltransferase
MTLGLMRRAGVESIRNNRTVKIAPQCYCPENITVEHDWSAASYWYQTALLADTCSILLRGATGNSLQGDAVIAAMCEPLGVHTQYTADGALLTRSAAEYARMDADFINAPDLVQTMAVTLCLKNIPFRFKGVKTLRVKETDRIVALQNELMKLGYCIETSGSNVLEWTGKRCEPQKNICISTYHDHRMAMAFAPAAILFPGIQIEDPGVVSKSYPGFWRDLQKAGFVIDRL